MNVKFILCVMLPVIGAELVLPVRLAKQCRKDYFTNSDGGAHHAIGCPNDYVIHIISAYFGEDTDWSGSSCIHKLSDCRIKVKDRSNDYYYNDFVDNCEGKQLCSDTIYAAYLDNGCTWGDRTDYVLIEYRCIDHDFYDSNGGTESPVPTRRIMKCKGESFSTLQCTNSMSIHIIEAWYGDIAALPESFRCPQNISRFDCRVNIQDADAYYEEIMACEGQTDCSGLVARAGINTDCQGDLGEWNEETEYVIIVYECVPETTTNLATTEEPTSPTTFLKQSTNATSIDLTTQSMTTIITMTALTEKSGPEASLGSNWSMIGVPVGVSLAVLVIVAAVITIAVVLVLRRRKESHKNTPPANAVSNQIYMSQLEDGAIPGNVGNNNHSQPADVYAITHKPRYAADNDLIISDNPMYASVPDPQPDSATILQDNPTYTEHMEDGRETFINDSNDYSNTALQPAKQSQSGHVIAENGDVYSVPVKKQKQNDTEDDLVMVDNSVHN